MTKPIVTEIKPKVLGFGDSYNPCSKDILLNAKLITELSLAILGISILGSGAILAITVFPVSAIPISIGAFAYIASGSIGLSSTFAISSATYYKMCKNSYYGVFNKKTTVNHEPISLGVSSKCKAFVCQDSKEGYEWKKKIIQSAKHNIVISGNYCGGGTFDEILLLIEDKLKKTPELKVVILYFSSLLTEENQKNIDRLLKNHPENFSVIPGDPIWHISPGLKKTINHAKAVVVDYGTSIILGGSGLEDKYSIVTGLGDRTPVRNKVGKQVTWGKRLISMFLPTRGFRDQDFVFISKEENGAGKRVYLEILKLANRWEGIRRSDLSKQKQKDDSKKSIVKMLLNEFDREKKTEKTEKKDFEDEIQMDAEVKIYCTGPEHIRNPFKKEIIDQIDNAKKIILINHMLFHPTNDLLDALVRAAERGVKIKILTNGYEKYSPTAHMLFGDRNRYNYRKLIKRVKKENRKNIEVFEFKVRKTTLHKKVIVVDNTIIGGSSNLGYKSLVTMSDHEINFTAKSKKMADAVVKIFNTECKKEYATKIDIKKVKFTTKQKLRALRHRIFAPLIG